jgi:hypothetical protein
MSSLAKPGEQPHFDSSDMLIIHNMFRREFALMPGLVGAVVAGDLAATGVRTGWWATRRAAELSNRAGSKGKNTMGRLKGKVRLQERGT